MLRIPCVAAILENTNGKVLLQLRDDMPGLSFAGHWTLPGGKVEEGEVPDEAICRELVEEIELEVDLKFWKVYDRSHSESITVEQHVYVGEIEKPVADLKLNEGQELRYFDSTEIAHLPLAFEFESLLDEFFKKRA